MSKVEKIWIVMIDLQDNCKIVHEERQRVRGDIYVNYKTAQKKIKFVMSSNVLKGEHEHKNMKEKFLE